VSVRFKPDKSAYLEPSLDGLVMIETMVSTIEQISLFPQTLPDFRLTLTSSNANIIFFSITPQKSIF
jgi:hypothetical protein